MASVTVRLPENIVHKIDINAHTLHMTRSEYIKKAILDMNHEIQERERKRKLVKASQRVREESMRINAEFAPIENDPKA
ncbi:MAG: CopG family transcriptional regulator [Proteobacteria bacterium]|nr:CopG family transcriptional regulator [Pseudomonadota bacterium]